VRFPVTLTDPCRQHTKLQLMQVLAKFTPFQRLLVTKASATSQNSALVSPALPVGCLAERSLFHGQGRK
jgi:hypothetical protein